MCFGGFLGLVIGGLLGIAVRCFRRSNKVDERILEAALDRHEEIARPWSPGGSRNVPPTDKERSDITRDPDREAPAP